MTKLEKLKKMSQQEIGHLLASGNYTPQQCQKLLKVWYSVKREIIKNLVWD